MFIPKYLVAVIIMIFSAEASAALDSCVKVTPKRTPESQLNDEILRVTIVNNCRNPIKIRVCLLKKNGLKPNAVLDIKPGRKDYHETYNPDSSGSYWLTQSGSYPRAPGPCN